MFGSRYARMARLNAMSRSSSRIFICTADAGRIASGEDGTETSLRASHFHTLDALRAATVLTLEHFQPHEVESAKVGTFRGVQGRRSSLTGMSKAVDAASQSMPSAQQGRRPRRHPALENLAVEPRRQGRGRAGGSKTRTFAYSKGGGLGAGIHLVAHPRAGSSVASPQHGAAGRLSIVRALRI